MTVTTELRRPDIAPGFVSYNELIPKNFQEELIQIRDNLKRDSFRIGDITNMAWVHSKINYPDKERREVEAAVGAFCGKKARTVREYAKIAVLFDGELRQRFAVLSFDHFRRAPVLAIRAQVSPADILEWAVEQVDHLGRPATVDSMEAHFCPYLAARIPIDFAEALGWLSTPTDWAASAVTFVRCMRTEAHESYDWLPAAEVTRINGLLLEVERTMDDLLSRARQRANNQV